MNISLSDDELSKLAHSIAFESSVSIIESHGMWFEGDWYDIDEVEVDPVIVADSIRYLEERGLLERHPEFNGWVRISSESEASRP